jgi:hypothetical protein
MSRSNERAERQPKTTVWRVRTVVPGHGTHRNADGDGRTRDPEEPVGSVLSLAVSRFGSSLGR